MVYRFLWLRSFHEPVSVRLRADATGGATAILHIADGAGGYRPGRLRTNRQRTVATKDVSALLALLDEAGYWTLPIKEDPSSSAAGFDGAQWIIEGRKGNAYHVVDRWSPGDGPFREAALLLLRLAGYRTAE